MGGQGEVGGAAGAPVECGAVRPAPLPQVTAAESAEYRWTSCGRIPSALPAVDSVFAKDGSVLSLDEGGVVRRFTPEAPLGVKLSTAKTPGSRLSLVADGARLIVSGPTEASVFEASGGGPIATGTLTKRTTIDLSTSGCTGPVEASRDGSRLAAQGNERACVWNADDGSLLALRPLAALVETNRPSLVSPTKDGTGLVVLRDAFLTTYEIDDATPASDPASVVDLREVVGGDRYVDARLNEDGTTLLVLQYSDREHRLIALDTATGAERWRSSISAQYGALNISSNGYVSVFNDFIYRIEDGARLQATPPGLYGHFDVSSDGLSVLQTTRLVRVWDLRERQIAHLYGGGAFFASLDMTPDGRFLAAGGFPSLVWRVAADFSQSETLFDASAEGASRVSLSPDGDALLLSGDVVALARRDGSLATLANDASSDQALSSTCLGNGWDFAPNGCMVAGFRYTPDLHVYDTRSLETQELNLPACSSVAFSPDGTRLMTADLGLLDTQSWEPLWNKPNAGQVQAFDSSSAIVYSPDGQEVAITRCATRTDCESSIYDAQTGTLRASLPSSASETVSYSPEGHWLASGNTLLHLPSGETRQIEASETGPTLFTPEGDVITRDAQDGSLLRFCRTGP